MEIKALGLHLLQGYPEITQFMTARRSRTRIFVWINSDLKGKRTCLIFFNDIPRNFPRDQLQPKMFFTIISWNLTKLFVNGKQLGVWAFDKLYKYKVA